LVYFIDSEGKLNEATFDSDEESWEIRADISIDDGDVILKGTRMAGAYMIENNSYYLFLQHKNGSIHVLYRAASEDPDSAWHAKSISAEGMPVPNPASPLSVVAFDRSERSADEFSVFLISFVDQDGMLQSLSWSPTASSKPEGMSNSNPELPKNRM
jgi:hypothetical protein